MKMVHRVAAHAAKKALEYYADMELSPEDQEQLVGRIERTYSESVLARLLREEEERAKHGREEGKGKGRRTNRKARGGSTPR